MKKFKTKTGFGYIKNAQGVVVVKCELPAGEHVLNEGHTFHEVNDADALQTVNVVSSIDEIRRQRNKLLKASDWTQLSDAPLTPNEKEQWVVYRKALRDIFDSYVGDVVWPEPPISQDA